MDADKSKELWDRLENEPERAYRAFESYLALPADDRTLLAAYRIHVGNPSATKPSDTWGTWSSRFAWKARAAAYDDYIASRRREAYARGVEGAAERQGAIAERMRGEAFEMLHRSYQLAADWLERDDFDPREMNMGQVIKVIRLHVEALRTFDMIEEPGKDRGWTAEDDAEFAQSILKEIEAEGAADQNTGEDGNTSERE